MSNVIIQEKIKIKGYIRGLEKNKGEQIFAIFIETENFQKFIVHNGATKDMIKYLNQEVKVTGKVINIDVNFNKIIEVLNFEILGANKI